MQELFRAIPSVDTCLQQLSILPLPHAYLRDLTNEFLDSLRQRIKNNEITDVEQLSLPVVTPMLLDFVQRRARPKLRRVYNATGVVIHTNLGRSVLAEEAVEAVTLAASGYCNLEFDLDTGERGSRHSLVSDLICRITGAEAALVVNNNAAAVLIMLDSLCNGGEVVVSRGQLVEIGGSFRIPDVMRKSGAELAEVGTTNRTHLYDYANAINEQTKALLSVHTSNYRIVGFHSQPVPEDLAKLAHERGIPFLEDLGSGSFLDFAPYGLPDEPTVGDVLKAGVDVVTFSGDKVLGGPQAGILAGKKEFINKISKNQLLRALRCDKMTLAALEATLRLYLDPQDALKRVPTLRRMTMTPEELKKRAQKLAAALRRRVPEGVKISLLAGESRVGGGSFPENDLPTTLVALKSDFSPNVFRAALLHGETPVTGRVEHDTFLLDCRTLADDEIVPAAQAVADTLANLYMSL